MSQDARVEAFVTAFEALRAEVEKVIVGHREIITHVLTSMFAGGHVLLEGVPGLGKTLLIKTLAEGLELSFSRIQFTPDLMPADIIGTNIIVEDADGRKHFQFQQGPIFAHILLADEINRATPKTQSALLEGMQEAGVTVGGVSRPLPAPFFVLATQNPIEMEGTYPLPEAQLDRFLFKLRVRYPAIEELNAIIDRTTQARVVTVDRVMSGARVRPRASTSISSSPRSSRAPRRPSFSPRNHFSAEPGGLHGASRDARSARAARGRPGAAPPRGALRPARGLLGEPPRRGAPAL